MGLPPMSLVDQLLTKPRESSGGRTSNRFDFQKNWALTHLLELHELSGNYVLVLEHHEDVAVLDCDKSPNLIDCYQVKTNDNGAWTLTALLARKKGKKGKALSILGKLCDNLKTFPGAVRSLNLVSNAYFNLTHKNRSNCVDRIRVKVKDLCAEHVADINEQLKKEHSLAADPGFVPVAHFRVTDLSLTDHSKHAQGKLVTFLDKTRPKQVYSVPALYRALFEEIKRKTNQEGTSSDFPELLERKGISRAYFEKLLDDLPELKTFETVWQTISSGLTAGGASYSGSLMLRRQCEQYEVQRMDRSNDVLMKLKAEVEREAEQLTQDPTDRTLVQLLDAGVASLKRRKIPGANVFSEPYIKAMLLLALHEY
jgi:Cap4 dsDNA endonuclease